MPFKLFLIEKKNIFFCLEKKQKGQESWHDFVIRSFEDGIENMLEFGAITWRLSIGKFRGGGENVARFHFFRKLQIEIRQGACQLLPRLRQVIKCTLHLKKFSAPDSQSALDRHSTYIYLLTCIILFRMWHSLERDCVVLNSFHWERLQKME